ncbi:MAG TPA: DUF1365 domain-containing protein [Steroidobacteraceae bacterium]|nr:DUF1365 domain-containing protein [Steroidobacteraceae bacterium]
MSTQSPVLRSAVYEGVVRHHRLAPRAHAFSYRLAQLYLDLEEIDRVFAGRWLWSRESHNLAEFRRGDYLGPSALPLTEAVKRLVERHTGRRPAGPVRLLTHPRYAGYIFNPVSFYYCYCADGVALSAIVAEITNTPWGERHAYVLPTESACHVAGDWQWTFAKAFHVSPFVAPMREYAWRFSAPGERLRVHMSVLGVEGPELEATLSLERRPLNGASLARVLWRYPLMTAQVIGAIHWEALRLWLKRTPIHDHPRNLQGT